MELGKKINEKKMGKSALTFSNYLDDYFGLIILVFVLLVFIGSFFLVLSPRLLVAMDNVSNVRGRLEDEKFQLKRYQSAILNYQEDYQGISDDDKRKIDSVIAPKEVYPYAYKMDLLISFSELLTRNGYDLTDIKVAENEEKVKSASKKKASVSGKEDEIADLPDGLVSLDMDLNIENIDYDKLKDLLALLEAKLRLSDIKSINYNPDANSCAIGLSTYRFWDANLWVDL